MNLKTVIMAGGKGTRISSIASDIPKPMIDICGKPLLERQIQCLKRQGITEITITVGHLGHKIQEYFHDGRDLGIKIDYIVENEPLGTAGALFYLRDCKEENLLLINGDIIFDIDIDKFLNYHKTKAADVTLFTHPNNHPYDSAIIKVDADGQITGWLNKEDERTNYRNIVNAGIHIISIKMLNDIFNINKVEKIDLDRDILKPHINKCNMYAYQSPEYVKDMGTPDRYYAVCTDFKEGRTRTRNLKNLQKAIFLDRDDTLIYDEGFMTRPEQVRLMENTSEALKRINQSGYLAIVVTNQPVIARGECTFDGLYKIHERLETLLGDQGAYFDDIFFCPHHPDKGFEGERTEYKIVCECRKPKPGLIFLAAEKYNIDLKKSFMVGDSKNDIQAGKAAGCKTGFLGSKEKGMEFEADIIKDNLLDMVESIFENEK